VLSTTIVHVWGWAAFASDAQSFYLSDVASNKIYQIPVGAGDGKVALTGPDGVVYDGPLALSPDGNWLAVATSSDETIHLFDMKSGKPQVLSTGDQQDQYLLTFSPDSSLLISAGSKSSVLWGVKTGKSISTFPGKQFLSIAFNPADTLLAVAIPQQSSTVPTKIELWGVAQ
jgi:WD40 repeat protein